MCTILNRKISKTVHKRKKLYLHPLKNLKGNLIQKLIAPIAVSTQNKKKKAISNKEKNSQFSTPSWARITRRPLSQNKERGLEISHVNLSGLKQLFLQSE